MKILVALIVAFALVLMARADVDKSVCSQPKEVRPCRGSAESYFYNPETKECEFFLYGGCKGNGNRFNTKDECAKVCL